VSTADKCRLNVTLYLPADAPPCDSFYFASQVPGSYEIRYYAKFIRNLVFVGKKGDTIPWTFVDSSCFILDMAKPIDHISYEVIPTFNSTIDSIMLFAGTYFNADFFQINPYGVFGFLPNIIDKPLRILLKIPGDWSIGTALPQDSNRNLYANNIFELLDSPILLGNLSYAAFEHNNKRYFIYTHSENGKVRARNLKGILKDAVKDVDCFLGGFPVDNYTFLVNIINDNIRHIGAHEHLCSSIYGFGGQKKSSIKEMMELFARHELFHVLSPLSLQSTEIYENRYTGKHPVTHLWFYEGLAQWATFKMLLVNHRISVEKFLNVLSYSLITGDTKIDSLNIIDCSRKTLDYHDMMQDIYRRGLVFGALLDVHIINKTAGQVTLMDVLRKMKEKYPPGRPFESDSLFQIIASLSHTEVKEFLVHYLQTNNPLPTREEFGRLGINYISKEQHPRLKSDFGFFPYNDEVSGRLIIRGVFNENQSSGFKPYDTLLTVDGEDFILHNTDPELVKRLFFTSPGTSYTATVRRNCKDTVVHAKTVPSYLRHVFSVNKDASPQALALRQVWMTR
jgi:predicted metalloprotease with PDZ domain